MSKYPTEYQKKYIWEALTLGSRLFVYAVGIGLFLLFLWFLQFLSDVLIPFALATVVVLLLEPIINWLQKHNISRKWAVVSIVFIAFIIFATILTLVSIQLIDFVSKLPSLIGDFGSSITEFRSSQAELIQTGLDRIRSANIDWKSVLASTGSSITGIFGSLLSKIGFIISFIVLPLYIFYLLLEGDNIKKNWKNYLPLPKKSPIRTETEFILSAITGYVIAFFRGQVVVSFAAGAIVSVGLLIIGLNYGLLLGVALAIFGIIPYVGFVLTLIPAIIIAFIQSDGQISYVALTAAIFILTNMFSDYYLSPKIMGKKTGLHPLVILLSILIWGKLLGGILGVLLAVPLTATLFVLIDRYTSNKKQQVS